MSFSLVEIAYNYLANSTLASIYDKVSGSYKIANCFGKAYVKLCVRLGWEHTFKETLQACARIGEAIIATGKNFSVPALCYTLSYVSQRCYTDHDLVQWIELIDSEFAKNDFIVKALLLQSIRKRELIEHGIKSHSNVNLFFVSPNNNLINYKKEDFQNTEKFLHNVFENKLKVYAILRPGSNSVRFAAGSNISCLCYYEYNGNEYKLLNKLQYNVASDRISFFVMVPSIVIISDGLLKKRTLAIENKSRNTLPERTKIGCNDPCPCGKLLQNGLPTKYKNCCGKQL